MIFNEVTLVVSDGKCAACVKNDVNDVGVGAARKERGDKIGVEIGSCDVRVKCLREENGVLSVI